MPSVSPISVLSCAAPAAARVAGPAVGDGFEALVAAVTGGGAEKGFLVDSAEGAEVREEASVEDEVAPEDSQDFSITVQQVSVPQAPMLLPNQTEDAAMPSSLGSPPVGREVRTPVAVADSSATAAIVRAEIGDSFEIPQKPYDVGQKLTTAAHSFASDNRIMPLRASSSGPANRETAPRTPAADAPASLSEIDIGTRSLAEEGQAAPDATGTGRSFIPHPPRAPASPAPAGIVAVDLVPAPRVEEHLPTREPASQPLTPKGAGDSVVVDVGHEASIAALVAAPVAGRPAHPEHAGAGFARFRSGAVPDGSALEHSSFQADQPGDSQLAQADLRGAVPASSHDQQPVLHDSRRSNMPVASLVSPEASQRSEVAVFSGDREDRGEGSRIMANAPQADVHDQLQATLDRPQFSAVLGGSSPTEHAAPRHAGALPSRPHVAHAAEIQMRGGAAYVRLDEDALGPIDVRVERSEAGLSVLVRAERSDSAELIRRNADLLQRELADSGVGHARLDFGQGGRSDSERAMPRLKAGGARPDAEVERAPPAISAPPSRSISTGVQLDMRL